MNAMAERSCWLDQEVAPMPHTPWELQRGTSAPPGECEALNGGQVSEQGGGASQAQPHLPLLSPLAEGSRLDRSQSETGSTLCTVPRSDLKIQTCGIGPHPLVCGLLKPPRHSTAERNWGQANLNYLKLCMEWLRKRTKITFLPLCHKTSS